MLSNTFKFITLALFILLFISCTTQKIPKEVHYSVLNNNSTLQELINSELIIDGDIIILDDKNYDIDSLCITKSIRIKSNKITSLNSNLIIADDLQVFLENLYINKVNSMKGNLINNGALIYLKNVKIEGEIHNLGHIVNKL